MNAPIIKFGGSAGGGKSIRAQAAAHLADPDRAATGPVFKGTANGPGFEFQALAPGQIIPSVADLRAVGVVMSLEPGAINRITCRQMAKARTRAKVLATAKALFTDVGYFDTGIRDIAKHMGMSTGAVFSIVPDKETLWTQAMGGPPPSQPLAEEVALLLAQLPGWRFLFKHNGTGWFAQLNSPCYSPERQTGQIYLAPNAASPAAALRKVRLDCLAFNAADKGRGH